MGWAGGQGGRGGKGRGGESGQAAIRKAEEKRVSSREERKGTKVGRDVACLKKKLAWQVTGRREG